MKIFVQHCLYCLGFVIINTHFSSYAMVTFVNNSHWAPLRLQIAIDPDVRKAWVPGNSQDVPLVEHAAIEISEITILPEKKFVIRTFPNQLLYLRLATYGNARNSQIMIDIINNVEIQVNDLGKGDILVERDLEIVNRTDKTVRVDIEYNGLQKDYGNLRQLWQDHINVTGIPWTRETLYKTLQLFPKEVVPLQQKLRNGCCFNDFKFKLPLMSFTASRGLLRVQCLKQFATSGTWHFDLLLPLTGSSNKLEIRDKCLKKMFALACALHPRAGASSPARVLTTEILQEILKNLPIEPYFVASIQNCSTIGA